MNSTRTGKAAKTSKAAAKSGVRIKSGVKAGFVMRANSASPML